MDRFIVSARKYRPQDFSTVVGQSHITTTLKNAIRQGACTISTAEGGSRFKSAGRVSANDIRSTGARKSAQI